MLVEMGQRLNSISFSMGFTKSITPIELLSLAQWIKGYFGDVSMQEVAHAFDMVTSKKIGAEIRHYNTFSQQYIGDVLHAYKEYRNKQMKLFKESEAQKLPEPKGATDQEMYEGIKKIALETGKVMKVANWTDAYSHAWKLNLIHRMSEQERNEYKEAVEKAIKTEERAGIESAFTTDIQSECHKRIMQTHFQTLIDAQ